MSLLSTFEAMPARLEGMYRFLARNSNGVAKQDLFHAMMPPSTTNETTNAPRVIVDRTMKEGAAIGLWNVDDKQVHLITDRPETSSDSVRAVIESHLWGEDGINDDLGYAIAWLLTHDPVDGAWTQSRVETAVVSTRWADETGISRKGRYGAFRDWAMYLGFAWNLDHNGVPGLMPDPTSHLRRRLPAIINEPEKEMRFAEFIDTLGEVSPVLDGGRFRKEVEQESRSRPPKQVSASMAFALDRLRSEGIITMKEKADDPDPRVVKRGAKTNRVSHITWHPTASTS